FVQFAREYGPKGIAIVAINPNDGIAYPEDNAQSMARVDAQKGFTFPYLIDAGRRLAYRGQFDASRPGNGLPVSGSDLRAAADALLADKLLGKQIPSIGCSIKWKSGQAPEWA